MRRSVLELWKRKGLLSRYGNSAPSEDNSAGPHLTPGIPQIAKRRLLLERLEERLLFDAGPQAPTDVDVQAANDQSMQAAAVADVFDSRLIEPADSRPVMTATDSTGANSNTTSSGTTDTGATVAAQVAEHSAVPVLDPNAGALPTVGTPLNTDAVAAALLTTADDQSSELHAATTNLPDALLNSDQPVVATDASTNPVSANTELTDAQRTVIGQIVRDSTDQIFFEKNVGQFADGVLYGFRTTFGAMLVYTDHLRLIANQTDPGTGTAGQQVIDIQFSGSNANWSVVPGDASDVRGSYQQPDRTVLHPEIFNEVTLRNVYDGVDLRLYSAAKGALEFDWIVARAQDYGQIRIAATGQDGIVFNDDGSATLDLRYQDLTLKIPESYQVIDGAKRSLETRMVAGDHPNEIRYSIAGDLISDQPLVIDPNVAWSTFFDLNDSVTPFDSYAFAIAASDNGVYVSGWVKEMITDGSYGGYLQVNAGYSQGTATYQNYIYRLDTSGTNITAWTSTGVAALDNRVSNQRLNGAGFDAVSDLELFPDGRVLAGFNSGLIQIYSADLSTQSYSAEPVTLDTLNSVAIVDNNSFYASGRVSAAIPNAEISAAHIGPDSTYAGGTLGFEGVIVRYSNATTTPTPDWATYVGGDDDEYFTSIALTPDKTKLVFATSTVVGANYPTLVNAVDSTAAGTTELLIGVLPEQATVPAAFSVLSFLGGSGNEGTLGTNTTVAVVTANNSDFWVAGNTASADLPGTAGGLQTTNGGGNFDIFMSRVPLNGSAGIGFQSTYLGGSTEDNVGGIAYDSVKDRIFVYGTTSGSFPTKDTTPTANYFDSSFGGGTDIFLSTTTSDLTTLDYSTYIGGSGNDYLGQTGDLIGQGQVYYSPQTDLTYLATTVHSTNLPTSVIGTPPGKDTSKSNAGNDTHIVLAFNINIYDYGDAPASYEAGTPAAEAISALIHIGTTFDAESGPASGAGALGDNNNNTGSPDDEDGIATLPTLNVENTNYSVNVSVFNNTGAAHTLHGWIDFNLDGVFEANEYASVAVPNNAAQQTVTLAWSGFTATTPGQSYLRLRLTDTAISDNAGTANIDERSIFTDSTSRGEIEDTALTINPYPTLSVNNVSTTEGTDPFAVFTVSLSRATTAPVSFALSLVDGSALGGAVDYGTGGAGNLQVSTNGGVSWTDATSAAIAAGQTSVLVRTPITNDTFHENTESFTLTASVTAGNTANSSATGTGTINDDDPMPSITINDVTVNEATGTATFTVTLSAISDVTTTVDFATSDGTATSSSDYTTTSGTLTFTAGTTSQTITVPILNDSLFENSETFHVNLSNPSYATIADNLGIGTILDNGGGAGGTDNDTPTLSVSNVATTEGTDPFAVFIVSLSNPSTTPVTFSLALADVTATGSGTDYGTGGAGNLQVSTDGGTSWADAASTTIAAGQTSVLVRTPIINDLISESTETFTLTATVMAGTTTNAAASGTGTINDANNAPTTADHSVTTNENMSVTFSVSDFPFSDVDAGNTLQSVKITSLPSTGSLTLSGVAVTANQVIPVGSLGSLSFAPGLNGSGSPYTTFTFQVSDGITFSNTATQTIDVLPPDLAVVIDDFATSLSPGQFNTYAVRVRNNGTGDATNVVLTTLLPTDSLTLVSTDDDSHVSFNSLTGELTWTPNIASLAPGNEVILLINTQVRDPIPAGVNDVVVTASVSSFAADPTPADNVSSDTDTLAAVPDLSVTTDDGGVTATAGDTVVYTVTYQNHGNQDATGAYVIETVPTGSTFNLAASTSGWTNIGGNDYRFDIGNLAVGTNGSILFAVKVDSTLPAGQTQLDDTATISDDGTNGPDPTPSDNTGNDFTPLAVAPDLTLVKSDGRSSSAPGAPVVYTLTAANNGTQDATGVVLTETLPAGTTFDSSNSSPGWSDLGGGQYEFMIGNLAAGSATPVLFAVTVNTPAAAGQNDIVNNASITDDGTNGADPTPANNSATDTDTLNAAPDYQVTIDDGQTTVVPGQSLTYQVALTNVGNQDGTGVVLSNLFPKQILHNVLVTGGGTVDETGGTIDWNIGNLAVGESQTFTITADVWPTIPAGWDTFAHSTSVTDDLSNGADPTPANNTASDTDTLNAAPDLRLTKDDSNTVIAPGQVAVYVLTKQNVGNQDATNVIITETVPVGTTFFAAQSDALWVQTGPTTYQITEALIPAGFYGSFLFSVLVDNPAVAGLESIVNTATFVDDGTNGPDPDPTDNTTTDTDTLVAAPDYQVTIDDGQSAVTPGQSLSYTINFTNVGNQNGTGVVVTNTFPISILNNVVASNGGLVDLINGTITWNVGNLNVGDSRSFTVTADVRNSIPAGVTQFTHDTQITDDLNNGADPTPANNSATDTDQLSASPAYHITIDDGQTNVVPGQALTYSVQFTNSGSQNGTGVVVTDAYPIAVLENVVASDGGVVDLLNGTITWNVGNLAVGESRTFTVTAKVRDTFAAGVDSFVHSTSIDDDHNNGADPDYTDNISFDTDILDAAPDLQLTKTDGVSSAAPGASLIYTLTYSNVGNQGATGAELIEDVPAGTTFDAANSTPGWALAGGTTYRLTIGNLPVGASGNVFFAVAVNNPAAAGQNDIVNAAYIIDDHHNGTDPNPSNDHATDTDTLTAAPDYSITIDDGKTQVRPGDTLIYRVVVANQGTKDGTGVVITDHFPSAILQNVVASDGGVVDATAGTITWSVGNLSVSGSISFTVTAKVRSLIDTNTKEFTHTASVTDDLTNGSDPTPLNNVAADTDQLQIYSYDSFHDWVRQQFAASLPISESVGRPLPPLPVDPIFSGLTEPGTTLVGRIYDSQGRLMGDRLVVADSGGNWLMSFPNIVIFEQPHRMEIVVTPAISNAAHETGFNLRRYFHPAIHTELYCNEQLSVSGVLRNRAYNIIDAMHSANTRPLGFDWFSHAYELNPASTNVAHQ